MYGLNSGEMPRGCVTLRAAHYRTRVVEEFVFEEGLLVSRHRVQEPADLWYGPGFVDLQCNGYGGVDYNHPDSTPELIQRSVSQMWRNGCTLVLPTVITASPERLELHLRKLVEARTLPEIRRSIPGFHLEGPFISPEDGARGAHPLAAVRAADWALFEKLQHAAEGLIQMVTLAPEIEGALPFIHSLREALVIPAIGHTMADTRVVTRACELGAMISTHLGNGCPQSMHRHKNPIFAQLGEPRLKASVIPDGIHLPPEVLYSIARAKGFDRTVLVTDAMAAAGAPAGRYTIGDLSLEVGEDRVVRQPGSANFAGSALTMDDAVSNFMQLTGASLPVAWEAASSIPSRLLNASGGIKRVDPGIVIAALRDGRLSVLASARRNKVLWLAPELG